MNDLDYINQAIEHAFHVQRDDWRTRLRHYVLVVAPPVCVACLAVGLDVLYRSMAT